MKKESLITTFNITEIELDKNYSTETRLYITFTIDKLSYAFELTKDGNDKWRNLDIFHDYHSCQGKTDLNRTCPLCDEQYNMYLSCMQSATKTQLKVYEEIREELKQFPTVRLLLLSRGVI